MTFARLESFNHAVLQCISCIMVTLQGGTYRRPRREAGASVAATNTSPGSRRVPGSDGTPRWRAHDPARRTSEDRGLNTTRRAAAAHHAQRRRSERSTVAPRASGADRASRRQLPRRYLCPKCPNTAKCPKCPKCPNGQVRGWRPPERPAGFGHFGHFDIARSPPHSSS